MHSQETFTLSNVEISAEKINSSAAGKKTETIDSTLKSQFRFQSLGDLLSANSGIYIKSYGPGSIASTAFRGGNASQTALLWNGLNIQNAMLGQADLSLLPAVLFDEVEVEYGGSSALWGSGAVGGSVLLKSKNLFGQGLRSTLNFGAGTLGSRNISAAFGYSGQKFISMTRLYNQDSKNNFSYTDATDSKIKQSKYSPYNFRGLMQEFKFTLGPRQLLGVNAWFSGNTRSLPAYDLQTNPKIFQYDGATRLMLDWTYVRSRFKSGAKAGYFNEQINYDDSLSALYTTSKVETKIVESDNYWQWNKNNKLNFGANYTSSSGYTQNYSKSHRLDKVSLLVGNRCFLLKEKLVFNAAGRLEFFSVGSLPLTGNVSGEYHLNEKITLSANSARVYRQPTLNELYWLPGGNTNLKAEQGYTYEGSFTYAERFRNARFKINAAAYSRSIDNWILWLPGAGGNPSPVNLQRVWSRGTETGWKLDYVKGKFSLGFGLISNYVLSTVASDKQENSGTLNRQLIYTPRYTFNGNFLAGYGNFYFTYFHQYVGYRFTASDNSQWLDPYQVSSLKVNFSLKRSQVKLNFFSACNNVLNSNYAIIAGRPMPLRNYEVGITFQTTRTTKTKT